MKKHETKEETWYHFLLFVFKNKIKENVMKFVFFILIVATLLLLHLLLHFPKTFSTSDLITYNSMFIVAAVFLLTYHLGELRDITTWIRDGKDSSGKPFYYDKKNTNQPSGKDIAEVKIFYVGSVILAIFLFALSSLLIILEVCAPFALILSFIASLIIAFLLIFTLLTYIKGIADKAI